ncbi:NDMA-dependent alcohol dehydrogenase [compost metagenome]
MVLLTAALLRAARMHGYKQPLVIVEVEVPDIFPTEVLVRVDAVGMCRTDFQLGDGYFTSLDLPFPTTPGQEIAGSIASVGKDVPPAAGLAEGDQVVLTNAAPSDPSGARRSYMGRSCSRATDIRPQWRRMPNNGSCIISMPRGA